MASHITLGAGALRGWRYVVILSMGCSDFAEGWTLASSAGVLRISVDGRGWRGLGRAETGDRYF